MILLNLRLLRMESERATSEDKPLLALLDGNQEICFRRHAKYRASISINRRTNTNHEVDRLMCLVISVSKKSLCQTDHFRVFTVLNCITRFIYDRKRSFQRQRWPSGNL